MQCLKVPNIAVLLLLLLLAVAGGVKAQVSLYTFSQSTGTYTPITGGTILGSTANNEQRFLDPANPAGSATDNSGPGFPIGFNFAYNGLMFDRIGIHTNGWISLGNSLLTPGVDMTSVAYLAPLSSSAVITPEYLRSRIAAVGADLQGQSNSELRVQTIGTAPNRVCVVQWTNYRRASQTAMLLNFQIRLNEAGNTVAIMFGNMVFGSLTNTADVGLGGFTAADFNNRRTVSPHNWNSTLAGTSNISKCTMSSTAVPPVNGRTFLFSPPACQAPYLWPVSIFSATTATINFTCTACTGTYVVEYGPPDFVPGAGVSAGTGGTAIVGSASPVVISGLLPLTYYDVYVRQDCGGAFSPNSGVQSFLTRPPGDDVCSPLTLTAGLNTGFTNSYASVQSNEPLPLLVNCNVQNAWCPDDGGLQNSLWFTFTPLQDGLYNFDCYGFNTQAALWQAASCSALLSGGGNLLAANDDGSTTQTLGAYLQNVCLLQGQTYFLQVDGYNGAEGPLTVNITFAGQPPAPTITCPANIVQSAGFTGCSTYVNVPLPVVNSLCSNYTLSNNYTNLPNASALYTAGITVVTYSVTSGANTNTCSFSVTVTNPQPPVVSCQNIAVTLSASGTASITPSAVFAAFDACFLPHTLVSVQPALFTCANVGSNTVTLTAADSQGNTATCAATVAVTDVLPPVVACQNTTVALNASGSATATPAALLATSSDNCTTVTPVAVSPALFTCANIGSNTATLTVQDASGNTATCTAQVLVQDQTPPAVVCQPFTVTLNALNTAVITPSNVFASGTDNCTTVTPLSVTPNSFGCQQVGNNTVTLVAADGHGNTSSCSATVTVNYAAQPAPICQNIGVTLNSLGMALVFPANVFAGSTDNCGALSPVAVNPALFTCSQVGQNTVTLFAADGNGNTSSCTATITVSDVAAPVAQCQNASVQLNAQGQATITPATLNNNSTDNCGITQLSLSQSLFTCNNTGNNTVTLTVADASGNTATCNAQLSVSDVLPPAAICQNVTVALNASGNYTLNASEINNGSTDNCAITALSVTPNLFTCANIGSNTVTLTVADASGNTATCAATVMVLFTFLPDELCKNATVALSPAGNATILPSDVFLGNTDNCAGISPVSVTPQNFGCANVGSNTVTLTVVNGSGFTSSCNATVTVTDNQSPNAACQNTSVNLLAGGTASIAAAQINNGSADNCGIAQVQVFPNSFTCANIGANTVTLTVTDVNGNTGTCTAQVTVNDNLPPVAQCQSQTVFLNASGTATATAAQVNNGSTDNCAITAFSVTPNVFTCANTGSNTVVLTVSDASGNSHTCSAAITVADNLPPSAQCQNATVTLVSGGTPLAPSLINNGSADNCGIAQKTVAPAMLTCANAGSNTVVLTVSDLAGNTATCSANVQAALPFNGNGFCNNISVNLQASGTLTLPATAVFTGSVPDACGLIQAVSVTPATFSCANIGINTVTLTTANSIGNTGTCTAQVVVNDNLPPVAQCQNQTVFLNESGLAIITPEQVNNGSTDNCGINELGVFPNTFTCADIGSNTVTLTASDAAGNTSTCAALVTVVFDFLPVDVCRNYAVELNSSGAIGILPADVFIGNADECGGVSPVLVTPNTFTCANVGLNTVTLTVVNTAGSSTTCNATVTISDSQPPVMQCQNQTVSLSASGNASITAAQVNNGSSDNCGISQLTVWPASFTCLQVGSNTVTLTASDASGNTQTCQAIITVADNLSPVMQCQNTTVVLNNTGTALLLPGQVNNGSADNCSISQLTVAPDFFTCANAGSNTVTLTAVDAGGNTGTCSAIVQVTLPFNGSSFCKNAEVSLTASGTIALPASAVFTGSVPDACGIIDAVSVSPAVFTCANVGINTVTLTTANSIGNTGTCTAQVAVADNLPPQLVCPSNVTSGNSPNTCGANLIIPAPSANDNCALLSVENNKNNTGNASGFYNPGTTTVTFTATDVNGNSSSCSFAVTVNDTQPPVVACPANIAVNSTACTQVVNWAVPAATDNCAVASLVAGITPGSVFSIGITTVVYTAQDESGNTSTCSFTVTIADTSPPAIVCPDNIAQTAVAGTCSAAVNWTLPQVTDACSGAVISNASHSPGTNFNTGITVVAYTAADSWGNTATCSFTITITDTQPPQITCPAAVVAPAVANSCQAALTIPLPVALDNCQISGLVNSYTGASNASGIYSTGVNTVTYTAADATGNTATCSFTVSVTDTQLPQITCPQNMVQTVSGTTCFSVVVVPLPAVTDNCAVAGYANNFTGTANASGAYLVGATTIVYTANDVNGNTASCSFTVTVNDAIAPVIVSCPASIIKPAIAGTCSATANWNTPVASDNCSAITLVASTPSGSTFNAGTTVVTYTATDVSGNTTTCSFTVTITDTTPPVISCPANISSCSTTPLWPSPNASDACLLGNITSNYAPGGYLPPGVNTITYTATDVSGNTATCSFTVTINNPVTLVTSTSSFNGNGVTCFGASNGIANAIAIGGTLPFTYQWSNGTTGAFVSGLPAGTYTVTVADALGCSATSSVVLTQPPPIVCSVNTTAASCANVNNGTATAVITGTGTYNYNWSGPVGPYVNASHLTGLSPGVYTVTVTNALGCTCSASGMVNSPPITGQLAGTLTTVSGGVAPLLYNFSTIAFTGGTAPYTFAWNTSGYVQYSTTSGNINIIYTNTSYWAVTISDNDPCTEGELVFSSAPDIDFGVLTILTATVTGDSGGSNGSITLTVIGGTPCSGNSYHYNWLGPSNWFPAGNTNTPNLTGLPSGWYVVSITDCGPDGVFNTGDEQEAYGYYWIAKAIRGRGKDAPPDAGMLQVIPNPISNDSQLRFIIPEDGYVTIALFDITGREQKVLYSQLAQGGLMYQIPLSSNLALVPGVYICQLRTDGGYRLQERIVWVK